MAQPRPTALTVTPGGRSTWVIPLAAAVLGLGGALSGAYLGARATIETQKQQADEDRARQARQKRTQVYSRFLDAAVAYQAATENVFDSTVRLPTGRVSKGLASRCAAGRSTKTCRLSRRVIAAYYDRQQRFQGALNDVYVFGSEAGLSAARELSRGLPASLYKGPRRVSIQPTDFGRYTRGYNALLDAMCREVTREPRPNCSG